MSEARVYRFPRELSIKKLGDALVVWFRDRKSLQAEGLTASTGYLVQVKSGDSWRKFVGMDKALHVHLIPSGDQLTATIGAGKWVDKAVVMGAGVFIFPPLMVTSGIGAWMQKKLPEEAFTFIEQYIMSGGKNIVSMSTLSGISASEVACMTCGALNQRGNKFCSGCGAQMAYECPRCHSPIESAVAFCPSCGMDLKKVKAERKCSHCQTALDEKTRFCPACGQAADGAAAAG